VKTLNEAFLNLSARRRYEVWFVRLGLADLSCAWWFRYLLMNPGRGGCTAGPAAMPVQVWASWFPAAGPPTTIIASCPLRDLQLSAKGKHPFHFRIGENTIGENFCRGAITADGHHISWDLGYSSIFRTTLSDKGWIGFSRTPHSDAIFSGHITLDGKRFEGHPLGFGLQGHNCGYRHRAFWTWTHAFFAFPEGSPSTLEALAYDMPFGLFFRRAVLWHKGKQYTFKGLREIRRERQEARWDFESQSREGLQLTVSVDGAGKNIHRLAYTKTDCSGNFEVSNNSAAKCRVELRHRSGEFETLETTTGAVLEMAG
jgi:hypothetical protein